MWPSGQEIRHTHNLSSFWLTQKQDKEKLVVERKRMEQEGMRDRMITVVPAPHHIVFIRDHLQRWMLSMGWGCFGRALACMNNQGHVILKWEQKALWNPCTLHAAWNTESHFLGDNLQKNKKVYKLVYETVKWFLRGGLYNWIIRTKEIWGAGRGLKAQHAWPHLV